MYFHFSSVQSFSHVWLCNPMDCSQAFLSITNSRSLLRLMSIEPVMPSNHLICRPLLLLPSIFPIKVFPNESVLLIRWPEYWSFSISPSWLLERKVMINLDSILKSRDITLPTKVRLFKAMIFPVVTYGCENWTIKKIEHWRIDALNCGVGEDSWEYLELQDQISQS